MNDHATPRRAGRRITVGALTGLLLLGSASLGTAAFAGPDSDHSKEPRTSGDTAAPVDIAEHSRGGPSCDVRDHGGKHEKGGHGPKAANAGHDIVYPQGSAEGPKTGNAGHFTYPKGAHGPKAGNAGRDFVIVCENPEGTPTGEHCVSGTDMPAGWVVEDQIRSEDGAEGPESMTVELTPLSRGGDAADLSCKSGPGPEADAEILG